QPPAPRPHAPRAPRARSGRSAPGPVTWTLVLTVITTIIAWYGIQRDDLPREVEFASAPPAAITTQIAPPTDRWAALSVPAITLPHFEPIMPPGEHRELFMANCVSCHSARLVTNQTFFPRPTWEGVVQKMVDVFGANLAEDDKPKIVDYLVSIRGR
ncbi:MAG: hypothetical protein ACF788_07210, partial [Novipirellula sp. JB048]